MYSSTNADNKICKLILSPTVNTTGVTREPAALRARLHGASLHATRNMRL